MPKRIKGNGSIVTKKITISAFNNINIGEGIECSSRLFNKKSYRSPVFNYTQSEGNHLLSITMDENLFPFLNIESADNNLIIKSKKGNTINPSRMEIKGSSTHLNGINVLGCIDLSIQSILESDHLAISISGASDIKMDRLAKIKMLSIQISGAGDLVAEELFCQEMEANVSGAGDISMKGTANNAKFTVTGTGDIKGLDLIVKDIECHVSGSGDLKINASETLKASVSGTGDIHYKGNAATVIQVTGFGDLRKVN